MAARGTRYGHRRESSPRSARVFPQTKLVIANDHGRAITVDAEAFAPKQQGGGWGAFAERFLRVNESALRALEVEPDVSANADGAAVRLRPGSRAGAVPLRSAQTGQVVGGLVVRPRFGWSGVGRVLSETGWHSAPQFLELPLVPGSGREIPPWVLAGPVLARLAELLAHLRKGYRETTAELTQPRGKILWHEYVTGPLARGDWHKLPCRFSDLAQDPLLRRNIKWCLERVRQDLVVLGSADASCRALVGVADRLLQLLGDVSATMPRRDRLDPSQRRVALDDELVRRGVEAMGWVVDERGLGGGRELDGLAWQLSLSELWESYVEAVVRREAAVVGSEVRVGRRGETTFPVQWTDPSHRALSHLAPDYVVRRGRKVEVIDAKYKAHLAELDESGWHRLTEDAKEAHRADFHQVLAYAALFDAEEITATLVYPLRQDTFEALKARNRDISRAHLTYGGRRVTAQLRGLPFGRGVHAAEG